MSETIAPAPDTNARSLSLDIPTSPLLHKCPYLAGRPPHGTYHLRPSGSNVCFARSTGSEPYGPVSKETQDRRCFCTAMVYESCPDFERARAQEIPVPTFGSPAIQSPEAAVVPGGRRARVKSRHRHRRSRSRHWWHQNFKMVLMVAYWTLIAVASCWVVWRTL
jgi:hypothetical protein